MASKLKASEEMLKRHLSTEPQRIVGIKRKRLYYLIVCEGEKTEPNYFKSLKNDLPKEILEVEIEGTGMNTKSLVTKALQLKEDYEKRHVRKLDRLWVAFDRDSFKPNDFNQAIETCKNEKPEIGCAWSNEAFELWYLLHFEYYNSGISRKQYAEKIEQSFKAKGKILKYRKNDPYMYALLKQYGSQELAIKNGRKLASLYTGRTDYAHHNPCTMVWKLVEELNKAS